MNLASVMHQLSREDAQAQAIAEIQEELRKQLEQAIYGYVGMPNNAETHRNLTHYSTQVMQNALRQVDTISPVERIIVNMSLED